MLGRILVNEQKISWQRFLIEYMGKTQDEADQIIAEALAEDAIMTNPALRAIRHKEAIAQIGAEGMLKEAEQDVAEQQEMVEGLEGAPTPKARPSEAANPLAKDTLRQSMGGQYPMGRRSAQV